MRLTFGELKVLAHVNAGGTYLTLCRLLVAVRPDGSLGLKQQ